MRVGRGQLGTSETTEVGASIYMIMAVDCPTALSGLTDVPLCLGRFKRGRSIILFARVTELDRNQGHANKHAQVVLGELTRLLRPRKLPFDVKLSLLTVISGRGLYKVFSLNHH